jgi:hypothetical protein
LPRSRRTRPLDVPPGTATVASPSAVVTGTLAPSAAGGFPLSWTVLLEPANDLEFVYTLVKVNLFYKRSKKENGPASMDGNICISRSRFTDDARNAPCGPCPTTILSTPPPRPPRYSMIC